MAGGREPHLISLWTVELLQWGQNFFNSSRSLVLRRFFWVVYRDTPGDRLAGLDRHSVHSRVITIRTPLFLAMGRTCAAERAR
jgi:hypothetical protein